MNLQTPWASSGRTPGLPVHRDLLRRGPIGAAALPPGGSPGLAQVLTFPWSAGDVRLPVRATTHPGLVTGAPVPLPRPTADELPFQPQLLPQPQPQPEILG